MGAHLADNPSLDEIAAAACFSKFHFHRLFQAHVGETVLEFTRRLRLDGDVQQQYVPAGRYAVHQFEAVNNDFQEGWDVLVRDWLPSSGYQPADGPAYETIIKSGAHDPEGRWTVEIHLPVKPL